MLAIGFLFLSLFVGPAIALITKSHSLSFECKIRHRNFPLYLAITPNGDGKDKRRSISPEELNSLFGSPSPNRINRVVSSPYDDDEENGDEEQMNIDLKTNNSYEKDEVNDEPIQRKLEDVVAEIMASSSSSSSSGRSIQMDNDVGDDEENEVDDAVPALSSDDSNQTEEDMEFYMDLSRVLEGKKLLRSVKESISVIETSTAKPLREIGVVGEAIRSTRYDPSEYRRGDPMAYGAYRRWQMPAEEEEKAGSRNGKGKLSRKQATGKNLKKGKTTQDKDGKDSFYNAIKNLGSGPSGGSRTTGVADPPANKQPITPKKAPMRKNKRKLITPNDIDSLFAPSELVQASRDKEDEDEEEEEEEEEESEDADQSTDATQLQNQRAFSPFGELDGTVPEWLQKAEKERKEAKQIAKRAKKQKKLTSDWRFWAAIVVTAGFASAVWSVYQQTAGFGGGPGDLGPGSGAELII